jgi:hypothetical protein
MCGLLTVRTKIARPPQDIIGVKGTTVSLPCGVTHDASTAVTWQWTVNERLVPSSGDGRRTVGSEGTLTILSIRSDDIGTYICHVTSTAGNASHAASLNVQGWFIQY